MTLAETMSHAARIVAQAPHVAWIRGRWLHIAEVEQVVVSAYEYRLAVAGTP